MKQKQLSCLVGSICGMIVALGCFIVACILLTATLWRPALVAAVAGTMVILWSISRCVKAYKLCSSENTASEETEAA